MEDLIALLCLAAIAIVTMVFYATWYGLVFLFLAGMAIFSGKYRQKLRDRWGCSAWHKFLMLLGTAFYLGAFVWAACFWWNIAFVKPVPVETMPYPPMTREEVSGILQTKTIPDLVDRIMKVKQRLTDEKKETKKSAPDG
ncbi:hypothetical protein WJU23_16335 [Prosthecobacter sp. SYSU 5D2]|uniref:hypothetical protein n=1 Tax=Prosthecobacter sp. SYSU 5D2 TaxID=3134134 RepID=UPI0031FE8BB3